MADQELNLILRLRDEATAQMKTVRGKVTAAAGLMAAAGLKVGTDWDNATKTIISGTGATGGKLKGLQTDYQNVAKFGGNAATVVSDLNTVFGATGTKLQETSAQVLKVESAFGTLDVAGLGQTMKAFDRDIGDTNTTLDTFVNVSQASGAPVQTLIGQMRTFGPVFKNAGIELDTAVGFMGAMETAGVDITRIMPALNSSLRKAATEGVEDLAGHLDDLIEEIRNAETGTDALAIATDAFGAEGAQRMTSAIRSDALPAMEDWSTMFGDATGAVERTYEAGRTWRDVVGEMKNAAIAYIGPAGDMLAGIGGTVAGLTNVIPLIKNTKIAQSALNLVMKANPIGLVITAIGLAVGAYFNWKTEIDDLISGAWERMKTAFSAILSPLETIRGLFGSTKDEVVDLSDELAGHSLTTALDKVNDKITPTLINFNKMEQDLRDVQTETRKAINDFVTLKGGVQGIGESFRLESTQINTGLISLQGQTRNVSVSTGQGWLGGFFDQLTGQGDQQDGFLGRMGGFMQTIQGGWQGIVTAGLNMVPVVGPLLASFGPALMKGIGSLAGKVWGGIKRLFGGGGTNEAEDLFHGFSETISDELKATDAYQFHFQDMIDAGWDESGASAGAAFKAMAISAGKSAKDGWLAFEKFHNAMEDNNKDLQNEAATTFNAWSDEAQIASDKIVLHSIWPDMVDAMSIESNRMATDFNTAIGSMIGGVNGLIGQVNALISALARVSMPSYSGYGTGSFGGSGSRAATAAAPWWKDGGAWTGDQSLLNPGEGGKPADPWWKTGKWTGNPDLLASGGPARAGRPYMVGERGPELFVPSESGSVLPNGLTAEAIGEAVARALHRVPLSIPQNAVTDSQLRHAPVRQALRGWS